MEKSGDNTDTLAEAYYSDGQFAMAVETEQEAISLSDPEHGKRFAITLRKYQRAQELRRLLTEDEVKQLANGDSK